MKLQHCKKAQVYNMDKQLLCEGEVVDIEENSATLQFPEPCSDVLRSEVLVTFMDRIEGLVTCFCRLSEYKEELIDMESGQRISTVQCTIESESSIMQRRNDIKVSVHIDTIAFFRNEKLESVSVDITILDISAGGLFCISQHCWQVGETFIFSAFDSGFTYEVEVLRVQSPHTYRHTLPDDGSLYGYGCRFTKLSAGEESTIRKYVFKQDLIQNQGKR